MSHLVLGLNTDHGDSAAVLTGEDGVIAAIAEERINRKKHCADFPAQAIAEVLRIGGVEMQDVTDIAVARNPKANLAQKAAFVGRHPQSGTALARRRFGVHRQVASTADRIASEMGIERDSIRASFHQVEHHLAHIASAFYWSPFERCVGFSNDGAGDFATTMHAECEGSRIRILRRSFWPHSMGVFYTAVCQFLGFDRYGEEYKVMGLSAYGRNRYGRVMREMMGYHPQHGLRLDLSYFQHQNHNKGFESIKDGYVHLPQLWGQRMVDELGPARDRSTPITERERDLAAAMQIRYEEVFLDTVMSLVQRTGIRNIVMAGGCALNSVANGRMMTEGYADAAYFQPAAADDGTAAGAASFVLHDKLGVPRTGEVVHSFWGTEWSDSELEAALDENGRKYRKLERGKLLEVAAKALAKGKIIGWFQGREEWGPRALGNRSILCNPAWPDMKATLNARIKNREPFRPFAPVIREERMSEVFEGTHPVPFMIVVYMVRPEWRDRIPAVTHEDGTGRVQTISREQNDLYYDLLGVFEEHSGVPVLLNTSFNENEPVVHTPAQAIDCFERTHMDALALGPYWMVKS